MSFSKRRLCKQYNLEELGMLTRTMYVILLLFVSFSHYISLRVFHWGLSVGKFPGLSLVSKPILVELWSRRFQFFLECSVCQLFSGSWNASKSPKYDWYHYFSALTKLRFLSTFSIFTFTLWSVRIAKFIIGQGFFSCLLELGQLNTLTTSL